MASAIVHKRHEALRRPHRAGPAPAAPVAPEAPQVILSFDVEEHYRIEAAAKLHIAPEVKARYAERLLPTTCWLLEQLAQRSIQATFFVVGEIARHQPALVRAIHDAGHEIASHGWDHRRVLEMTPAMFRKDVRKSKDALEQAAGVAVVGYRAPTFSITRKTAWALDVLVESGMLYDSSIYPVRHDRYGVPSAPRAPFRAAGEQHAILELPPATLRILGMNAPMGGGGYFRLFPLWFTEWALRQTAHASRPAIATLYFHPWEFDPEQARLPLKWLSRFRTYVGLRRSSQRLQTLLMRHGFARAIDVARRLAADQHSLPVFDVAAGAAPVADEARATERTAC